MSELQAHDGYLGPDAVAWRVIGHPVSLVGGLMAEQKLAEKLKAQPKK